MRKRKSPRPSSGPSSSPVSAASDESPASLAGESVPPTLPDDDPLAPALKAALASTDDEAFDGLEEAAAGAERPEVVADLYAWVIQQELPDDAVARIGQRALRLHDEWFDDPTPLVPVLDRVVDADPDAYWAFDRLVLVHTNAARWNDLLGLYDRLLEKVTEKSRRTQLLDEAAHVAKDFAGAGDRAIAYLQQLLPLRPSDPQLATSLERLFERQGRHKDLVDLWEARLPVLSREGRLATRARIAACLLDKLSDPAGALAACQALLADDPHDTAGAKILERLVDGQGPSETRDAALGALRDRYVAQKKPADVARVLEKALLTAAPAVARAMQREIAELYESLGKHDAALEHCAALVALDPADDEARAHLQALAERTGRHARYAEALVAAVTEAVPAAVQVSLLVEAARVRSEVLSDAAAGTELLARALGNPGCVGEARLLVARRLSALLEAQSREKERLDVLEELGRIEPDDDERTRILGQVAVLADELGETERSLAAWRARLGARPDDGVALDALVMTLEREERWTELVAALRQREGLASDADARRRDRVRIAELEAEPMADPRAAVATWRSIERDFGASAETVDALAGLLSRTEDWSGLGALLEAAAAREEVPARRADLLRRLGDVSCTHLGDPRRGAEFYRDALAVDDTDAGARAGLRARIGAAEDAAIVELAVRTLADVHARRGEVDELLSLTEHRLQVSRDDAERSEILVGSARLAEQSQGPDGGPRRALELLARAFALVPDDVGVELDLVRLAGQTDGWETTVAAFGAAAMATTDEGRRASLRIQRGSILEGRLDDPGRALAAFQPVLAAFPDMVQAALAVVRVGARTAAWQAVADAVVEHSRAVSVLHGDLVESVTESVQGEGAWTMLLDALEAALAARRAELAPAVARALEAQVGIFHRDRRNDAARAEAAFERAIAHDPADAETLRMQAVLQRGRPDARLLDTLLALAAATDDDLAVLYEAAQVALDVLEDVPRSISTLERLLRAAGRRWERTSNELPTLPPESAPVRPGHVGALARDLSPDSFAAWALERLVQLHLAAEAHGAAVDVLVAGAALPFGRETALSLRHRAAAIAAQNLPTPERAIELYRGIVADVPTDTSAVAELAAIYERTGAWAELAELRRHELALPDVDLERRLFLRLELARTLGHVPGEGDEARIEALTQNLEDSPGHAATIDAIAALLEGNEERLARLLSEQALVLEGRRDDAGAARLWARVARLVEGTGDHRRALDSWGRVVALVPTVEAFDALARLHAARGEHADAVRWLERRLEATAPEDREPTVVALARAHEALGDHTGAVRVLEEALAGAPSAREARGLLAEMFRTSESWPALAETLVAGASYEPDPARKLAFLREAAEVYVRRLEAPAEAIALLSQAVEVAGEVSAGPNKDVVRPTRVALADALRRAERLDEARAILDELVEWYGRRRPPERAQVHAQLAELAHARGDAKEALSQLDLASSMDMGSPSILLRLGSVARAAGELARAERALRALLLLLRRPNAPASEVGPSEVLFELYEIATALDQPDRARENLESAFEAATANEAEQRRFARLLKSTGNEAFLVRALEARVAASQDPTVTAMLLVELAEALTAVGRFEDALRARLEALGHDPSSSGLHEATRAVAEQAGQIGRYEGRLVELAERAKEAGDPALEARLLVRLADVYGADPDKAARAVEVLTRVDLAAADAGLVAVQLSALRALERLHRAANDRDGEARVLGRVVQIDDQDAAERTESIYRLAELLVAEPSRRDEGLEMLGWAIDRDLQSDRALALLRPLPEADGKVAALFERVARAQADDGVLLEALVRVAAGPDPSLDVLREATDLAARLERGDVQERLLFRTVEVARAASVVGDAVWAFVALADAQRARGDVATAIALLREAGSATSGPDALELELSAASAAAGAGGDLEIAQTIYEGLLARDPADRRVWEPLLDVLRRRGDRPRLEALIESTVENVFDPAERNVLRVERTRLLLDQPGREEAAAAALREILDDEPEQHEAAAQLAALYRQLGHTEELRALLEQRVAIARDQGDAARLSQNALALGELVEKQDRLSALEIFRDASSAVPEDKALLLAVIRLHQPSEDDAGLHADALERLLALETGEAAAAVALDLASLRGDLGDEDGVVRALTRGFHEAPAVEKIRLRLERLLVQRGDHEGLADLCVRDAAVRTDDKEAVERLREAARIHAESLGDPARAAEILRHARTRASQDLTVLAELVRALIAAGAVGDAAAEVGAALDGATGATLVALLRMRAEVALGAGDDAAAVVDLEAAYAQAPSSVLEDLVHALERRRASGAADVERAATLRLAELFAENADPARARDALVQWLDQNPRDTDALAVLARIAKAGGDVHGVVEAYKRIVPLEQGEAQGAAALELADACDQAGRSEEARPLLELALEGAPGNPALRDRLRQVYQTIGAYSELAHLTLVDAAHAADDNARFDLLLVAGDLYLRTPGEEQRSIEPLTQALGIKPGQHDATVLLADALTLLGDVDRAVEVLTPAIDKHKGRRSKELAQLQHRMARAANAGGGRDVEMSWLQKALECDMQNGHVAAELAEVAMELQQWEIALKALKAVTLLRTPGPMSRPLATLRQAQIAHFQGDAKRAVLLAKKALADDPSLSEAEEFLHSIGA